MKKNYFLFVLVVLMNVVFSFAQNANVCLELSSTGVSSDGFLALEWQWLPPMPIGNYGFTLHQWDEALENWQTVSTNCDRTIHVLNIYPDIEGSNTLQTWMHDPTIGLEKIIVTPVSLSNFNANPNSYLKDGGEYIYDVLMFGSWDDNHNGSDINAVAVIAVKEFLDSGRGVLFGHDTQHWNRNFALLAAYINMDILENNAGYFRGSEHIEVVNDGFLLKYPHHIPYGEILDIPCTHTSGQFAKGIVWMNFPDQVGPCFHAPVIEQPNGGTNDFYLTTWNNAAMIQTGHSNGQSTLDERKVIANTLWYLAQFTTETTAKVCSAFDLAAPNKPTIERHGCNLLTIKSTDNGTPYHFYVTATHTTNYADTCTSNIAEVIHKTGLRGFYILEDINPNSVPESSNPATIFMAAVDEQWVTYLIQDLNKYVHIQAVDFAGNLSEVAHIVLGECEWKIATIVCNGGMIEPVGNVLVEHGNNKTFTITPDPDYEIDCVYIDGIFDSAAIADSFYTFNNVVENHTIMVCFKRIGKDCPAQVIDPANNIIYNVVELADRCWYKENARSTKYQDGTEIPFAQSYAHLLYPNVELNKTLFGLLYTYTSVFSNEEKAICPAGWSIPTATEWILLNRYDMDNVKNPLYWITPNTYTNVTDFDIRGAGLFNGSLQRFEKLYGYTGYWCFDKSYSATALGAIISYNCITLEILDVKLMDALSVRCIKD